MMGVAPFIQQIITCYIVLSNFHKINVHTPTPFVDICEVYVNNERLKFFYCVVSLLKDLKHVNIVTLHDIIHTDQSLTLIFEYVVRV